MNGKVLVSPPSIRRNTAKLSARKPPKKPFELSEEDDENEEDTGEAVAMASDNGVELPAPDDMPILNGDESMQLLQEDESVLVAENEVEPDSTLPIEVANPDESLQVKVKRKRGRPKKNKEGSSQAVAPTPQKSETIPQEIETAPQQLQPAESSDKVEFVKPRRGKPPKPKPEVYHDPEEEVNEGPSKPAKRPRLISATEPSTTKRRPPPSQRDPNATITSLQGDEDTSKEGHNE